MAEQGIKVLDGWRGCAILSVLVGHFWLIQGINLGRLGVELFFVLSGRLMAEILFVRRADLSPWAVRRAARLVPALWFFAAIVATVSAAWLPWGVSPEQALAAATFTSNYLYGVQISDTFGHIWSLCIEVHCYIVMAAVAWFGRGLSIRTIALTLVCLAGLAMLNGVIQSAWLGLQYYDVYWRSDTRGASILVSAGLFLLLKDLRSPWLFAVFAPLGVVLQINAVPDALKYTLGTVCLAIGVAAAPHAHSAVRRVLTAAPLTALGLVSYSLYLWQQPFKNLPYHWTLTLTAAIGVGVLAYYAIERPLRRALVPERSRTVGNVQA